MYTPKDRNASERPPVAPRQGVLLIYAIVLAAEEPLDLKDLIVRGLQDAPVFAVQEGAIAALVTELPNRRCLSTPSCADILAFDAVLERLGATHTLLPVRYGSTAESEASLRELLRARGGDYRHSLMEMDGCTEMCVRLLPGAMEEEPASAVVPLAPEPVGERRAQRAQSLLTRRQHLDRVYVLASRYLEHFAPWVLRHRVDYYFPSYEREGQPVLALYFLIQRAVTGAFQEACQALTQLCRTRVLLSGPSPPLTFAPSLPLLASP